MPSRSIDEVRDSFEGLAQRLDGQLMMYQRALMDSSVEVRNLSPGGIDNEFGFHLHVWHWQFARRQRTADGETAEAMIKIKYTEPMFTSQAAAIELGISASIFRPGSGAVWQQSATEQVTIDQIETAGMGLIIQERLRAAEHMLKEHIQDEPLW